MKQGIFLLVSMFIVTACTKVQPYVKAYKIEPRVHVHTNAQTQCSQKSIRVANVLSQNSLMLDRMHYVSGQYNVASFTESKWSEAPNKAIHAMLMKVLENAKLYKHVAQRRSVVKSDVILENNLEDFMQYFVKNDTQSYVRIVLSATLVDRKTKRSLASRKFIQKEETKSSDAYGGVVALNTALGKILQEELLWLEGECR